MNVEKKLKSGLRKCPLHKFGATYNLFNEGYFHCDKCKGFTKVHEDILRHNKEKRLFIQPFNKVVMYEFICDTISQS